MISIHITILAKTNQKQNFGFNSIKKIINYKDNKLWKEQITIVKSCVAKSFGLYI